MNDKFLPIGSICTIKGSNRKVMIMGFFSIDYTEHVKLYDYIGCIYPEGVLASTRICFNHSDIISLDYMGYKNSDFELFNQKLKSQQVVKSINNESLFSNFEFDENGVVVFAQPMLNETSKQNNSIPETLVNKISSNVNNPFYKTMDYEKTRDIISTDDKIKEWPIFKNIQFDENGVVISAE